MFGAWQLNNTCCVVRFTCMRCKRNARDERRPWSQHRPALCRRNEFTATDRATGDRIPIIFDLVSLPPTTVSIRPFPNIPHNHRLSGCHGAILPSAPLLRRLDPAKLAIETGTVVPRVQFA